jgi:hypothetical protein
MTQNLTLSSPSFLQGQTLIFDSPDFASGALVLVAAASGNHLMALTDAKSDAGVPLTSTATGGAMGVSRTAGTSLVLVGEATSASAKTDKALFLFNLPSTYVAAGNFTVSVNCAATGGTITAATTTMTVNAYTEVLGVETGLTVSAAQEIPATAATLTFTVTGVAGMAPGSQIAIELVMLVTTSASAGTGTVYSVSYSA